MRLCKWCETQLKKGKRRVCIRYSNKNALPSKWWDQINAKTLKNIERTGEFLVKCCFDPRDLTCHIAISPGECRWNVSKKIRFLEDWRNSYVEIGHRTGWQGLEYDGEENGKYQSCIYWKMRFHFSMNMLFPAPLPQQQRIKRLSSFVLGMWHWRSFKIEMRRLPTPAFLHKATGGHLMYRWALI